jgi:uncharacterized protein (DUF488 family)
MNGKKGKHFIFTLGYQNLSIQQFIGKLESHSIRILIDVRKNPISRKAGFSKRSLSESLNKVGIEYYHFPELGVPSNKRKELVDGDRATYESLFNFYETDIVSQAMTTVDTIKELANENKRIALTCFETDHNLCHRGKLSEIISRDKSFADRVMHI